MDKTENLKLSSNPISAQLRACTSEDLAAKALVTRKTVFQVRHLSSTTDNGSNKGWLRKLRIIAKTHFGKTFFGLGDSDLKLLMCLLRKMFSLKFSQCGISGKK